MPESLEQTIRRLAAERCEYCRMPESVSGLAHVLDHIIARQHGGKTERKNLSFCCGRCNQFKGREAKGWSQEEMAFRCGVRRTYVGGVERGECNASILTIRRFTRALLPPGRRAPRHQLTDTRLAFLLVRESLLAPGFSGIASGVRYGCAKLSATPAMLAARILRTGQGVLLGRFGRVIMRNSGLKENYDGSNQRHSAKRSD